MADRSTHPTAVEYGVREMMKGKSPAAAAKSTAKRLNGAPNMFLGSPTDPVEIDPSALEPALWDRMVDVVVRELPKLKGSEHYAIRGAMNLYEQPEKMYCKIKERTIQRLGNDPFTNDPSVCKR